MAELSIQEKMNSYLTSHSELKGKSEEVILSAMQREGLVTQAEIDSAKSTSAFGFGFNKTGDMGLSIESGQQDTGEVSDGVKKFSDEEGNQITIKYENGYPTEKTVKKSGTFVSKTTYEYKEDSCIVKTDHKDGSQTAVLCLDVDEQGNIPDEKFIYSETKNKNGTAVILFMTPNGLTKQEIGEDSLSTTVYETDKYSEVQNNQAKVLYKEIQSSSGNGVLENGTDKYAQIVLIQGETISDIAKKYGTTVAQIKEMNPGLKDANKIKPGEVIIVKNNSDVSQSETLGRKTPGQVFYEKERQQYETAFENILKKQNKQTEVTFPLSVNGKEVNKFNKLEDAARYVLSLDGITNPTKEQISICAKELTILNSEPEEKDINKRLKSALENINNGKFVYVSNNNDLSRQLSSWGLEPSEENYATYQKLYAILEQLSTAKNNDPNKDTRDNMALLLLDFEHLLNGEVRRDDVDNIAYKAIPKSERTPDELKYRALKDFGINIYEEERSEEADDILRRMTAINISHFVTDGIYRGYDRIYNNNGAFVEGSKQIDNLIDWVANLFGADTTTGDECVAAWKKCRDTLDERMKADFKDEQEFKQFFKSSFGIEYDKASIDEITNFVTEHKDDKDLLKNEEFQKLYQKAFGLDLASFMHNIKVLGIEATLGNIELMVMSFWAMGGSSAMQSFTANSAMALSDMGLTGKTLQVAHSAITSGTLFATYTAAENVAATVMSGKKFDMQNLNKISGNVLESFAFGSFAGAFNVMASYGYNAIRSATVAQRATVQCGVEALEKAMPQGAVKTGTEVMQTFYSAQFPTMANKLTSTLSKIGRGAYTFGSNVAGFTIYNTGKDLIQNPELVKEGGWDYVGQQFMAQLQGLATFEGVRMLLAFMITGKIGMNAAMDMNIHDGLEPFETLKNMNIETIQQNGQTCYKVSYPKGEPVIVGSMGEVVGLCQMWMVGEMNLRNSFNPDTEAQVESIRPALTTPEGVSAEAVVGQLVKPRAELPSTPVVKPETSGVDPVKSVYIPPRTAIELVFGREQLMTNTDTDDALPADGIRNRFNQKRNQLYIRLQSIDGKYRDAAADRIDMSTPREVFEVIDATPEELAKFIEKYTQEVEFADGSVDKRIVIGDFNYTPELLNAQIEHLRNLREFLDTQSIPARMTVHRSDSYSIMEQIDINGRSLAEIMNEAVENNNVEDVLKMLNEGDFSVNYDNFVGTSLRKIDWQNTKVQWEINVPKGTKGAYVELMTKENIPEEKEFLLQAGSTLKIKKAEFKDGKWCIKADLVQDAKPEVKVPEVLPETDIKLGTVYNAGFSQQITERVSKYDLVYALGVVDGNPEFTPEVLEERGIKVLANEHKDSALRYAVYEKDDAIIIAVPGFKSPKQDGMMSTIKDARAGAKNFVGRYVKESLVPYVTFGFSSDAQLEDLDAVYRQYKDVAEREGKQLILCGHSLGGAHVRRVATNHADDVTTRFVSFNALATGKNSGLRQIESYHIKGDDISDNGHVQEEGTVIIESKAENKHRLSAFNGIVQDNVEVKSEFKVERNTAEGYNYGSLSVSDNSGNTLGNVNYDLREVNGQKALHFEGLISNESGKGIGTRLINELIELSKEMGAEGRLVATASPMKAQNGKMTNLEFYYKLGFRASDDAIDAQIRECIDNGKEIPLSLNIFTEIEYSPKTSEVKPVVSEATVKTTAPEENLTTQKTTEKLEYTNKDGEKKEFTLERQYETQLNENGTSVDITYTVRTDNGTEVGNWTGTVYISETESYIQGKWIHSNLSGVNTKGLGTKLKDLIKLEAEKYNCSEIRVVAGLESHTFHNKMGYKCDITDAHINMILDLLKVVKKKGECPDFNERIDKVIETKDKQEINLLLDDILTYANNNELTSRDLGIFHINIPMKYILDTAVEPTAQEASDITVKPEDDSVVKSDDYFEDDFPDVFEGSQVPMHHNLNALNTVYRVAYLAATSGKPVSADDMLDFKTGLPKMLEIDREFAKLPPLEKNIVVWRGRSENPVIERLNDDFRIIDNAKVGDIIVPDVAYSYAAFERRLASNWSSSFGERTMMLEIRLPQGAKVSRNLEHGGEVVIPRNAEYRLLSKTIKDDHIEVELEYILPENDNVAEIETLMKRHNLEAEKAKSEVEVKPEDVRVETLKPEVTNKQHSETVEKVVSYEELEAELRKITDEGKITNRSRKTVLYHFKSDAEIGEIRELCKDFSIKKLEGNKYAIITPDKEIFNPDEIFALLKDINFEAAINIENEYKNNIIGISELKVIAEELSRVPDEYTPEIMDACLKYKNSSKVVNDYLRYGTFPDNLSKVEIANVKKRIKVLQQAIESLPCEESIRLYRGASYDEFRNADFTLENGQTLGEYLKSIESLPVEEQNLMVRALLEENDITLIQKSFLSTSIIKNTRAKDEAPIQFNLTTDGTVYGKVLDVHHITEWNYETEYLLGQNTQIKIRKIERKPFEYFDKDGKPVIEMKWVIDAVLSMP